MNSFKYRAISVVVIVILFLAVCMEACRLEKQKAFEEEQVALLQISEVEKEPIQEPVEVPSEDSAAGEEQAEELPTCDRVYDFEKMKEENADIYACINVPGTIVEYPIVQCEEDNYYLNYNLDHSKGLPGAIYTNKCNAKDFSDANTVIYGHNMKNKTMFGDLHAFEDPEFFAQNRSFFIYTEEYRYTYEIVIAAVYDDTYLTMEYEPTSGKDMLSFTKSLMEFRDDRKNMVENPVFDQADKLVTLSTCVKNEGTRRFLVVGRLIETAKYE